MSVADEGSRAPLHAPSSSRRAYRFALSVTIVLALFTAVPRVSAQDTLLLGVAYAEALAPAGVLLIQGAESGVELGLLGAALALYTAPNVALLFFEANDAADGVRISRLISSGIGLTTSALSLGFGVAAAFGALDSWGLTPYAGSLLALSVPTLFAGIIDLIEYSVESEP